MQRLILVTGTPGVGKTTFSQRLARIRKATLIDLNRLLKREKLANRVDHLRRTRIADLDKARRRVKSHLRGLKGEVIVEGHLSHLVLDRKQNPIVFVVRCDPGRLARRLSRKKCSRRKIEENVMAEVLDVCLAESVQKFGLKRIAELDTTWWRPTRMAQYASRILDGNERPQLAGTDWMGTLAESGLLKGKLEKWSRDARR